MRVRSVTGTVRHALGPWEMSDGGVEWLPADVPGTAASALAKLGRWSFERPRDFDATDWLWRCRFSGPGDRLVFEGLATACDAILDGAPLFSSENMFTQTVVALAGAPEHELVLRFRSLGKALEARRPRPRWKTRLVGNQQLRWFRTTLLGRIPGWSPPVAPVGPWRPVWLERGPAPPAVDLRADPDGTVHVQTDLANATLVVGESQVALSQGAGSLRVPGAALWWPWTHGPQPLYPARLISGETIVDLGDVGFRSVSAGPTDGDFRIVVNGETIFCRGACWTTSDIVSLRNDPAALRAELELFRRGGFNLIRVGGTMVYEDELFHDLCDELGLLVWQDFMFANLDYPTDEKFVAEVRREAREVIGRLQGRPSLGVLCGNSEIEQQVSMLGMPRELWSGPLFQEVLPGIAREVVPGVPYVPSSPTGGTLPFHPDVGVAHYYGVGAYLRPLEDARRAEVRFTSECLAFSNVPETPTIEAFLADGQSPAHHPRWKERVPRDTGPGWDFEDVRDHYVKLLFGVDPAAVRYADTARWLDLGRVATGTVIGRTLAEWRRARSTCKGGVIWFWKDLWPGAGWGIIDALGRPKAAYYLARRALAPVALWISDEGLAGPRIHAANDGATAVEARLDVRLWRQGSVKVAEASRPVVVPARGELALPADALFERFLDLSFAYRFGPPGHDALVATLTAGDLLLGEAFYLPRGLPFEREPDVGLHATGESVPGGYRLTLTAERLALAVALEAEAIPDENYVDLEPGRPRAVFVRASRPFRGELRALNAHATCRIVV